MLSNILNEGRRGKLSFFTNGEEDPVAEINTEEFFSLGSKELASILTKIINVFKEHSSAGSWSISFEEN